MPPKSSSPNQLAVARLAGVSRQSVSLALNHPEKLDPETRSRIDQALTNLGYVPNQAARNFKAGRAGTLAMCFRLYTDQDFSNPFLAQTLKGLHEAASKLGFGIRFQPLNDLSDMKRLYESRAVDGLIFMSYQPERDRNELVKLVSQKIPLVLFAQEKEIPSVDFDFDQGMELVASALDHRSPKSVGYFSGGLDLEFNQLRFKALQTALARRNRSLDPAQVRHNVWSLEQGRQLIAHFDDLHSLPEVLVFADGDFAAFGAAQELLKRGIRIPQDVGIISGDGSYLCELSSPVLTSLKAPYELRAATAVRRLAALVEDFQLEVHLTPALIPFGWSPGGSL